MLKRPLSRLAHSAVFTPQVHGGAVACSIGQGDRSLLGQQLLGVRKIGGAGWWSVVGRGSELGLIIRPTRRWRIGNLHGEETTFRRALRSLRRQEQASSMSCMSRTVPASTDKTALEVRTAATRGQAP